MNLFLHAEQARGFLFDQARHRDSGPGRHDLRDVFLADLGDSLTELVSPGGLLECQLVLQLLDLVANTRGCLEVLLVD